MNQSSVAESVIRRDRVIVMVGLSAVILVTALYTIALDLPWNRHDRIAL